MTHSHTAESPEPRPQAPESQQKTPRRPPGWARTLLALLAFEVAAFSSALAYLIGPLRDGYGSNNLLLRAEATTLIWLIPLPFYLLFTVLLTRCADHRPMRAAGLTLNRRALLGTLAGTGISVAVVGCLAAVLLAAGIGTRAPAEAKEEIAVLPLWLVVANTIVFSYVFQGIGEEALMRGYLLQSLSDHPRRAVWTAVIVFTIPHLLSNGGQQNALDHVLYLAVPLGFALAAACLALIMRSTWAAIGIHGGYHLGNQLVAIMGLSIPSRRLVWITTGLVFCVIAAVLASRISKQRWAEIAASGPYAPPAGR